MNGDVQLRVEGLMLERLIERAQPPRAEPLSATVGQRRYTCHTSSAGEACESPRASTFSGDCA